jgi:hypothetical protein
MFGTHIKMSDVNLKKLPDGTYHYCAKCKTWFGKQKPPPSQGCPHCGTPYGNATGLYEKKSGKAAGAGAAKGKKRRPDTEQLLAILALLFLASGACFYFLVIPTVRRVSRQSQGTIDALGDAAVSSGILAIATLLLFALFSILLVLLLYLGEELSPSKEEGSGWARAWDAVSQHGRLVGTLLNALASLGALLLASALLGRAPDLWALGIQLLIAFILERAILKHWDRYLERLHAALV